MKLTSKNNIFDSIFDDHFYEPMTRNIGMLKSDIYEFNDNYVIDMDVPGLKKEDITIDYEDNYLTVSVKKEQTTEDNTNYIRRERYFGEYKRSFYIGEINEEDIKAKFSDGMLKIVFPKTNEQKNSIKHINIE